MQPKISVIVPIYKVEKYLVQCLDSILNQTFKDIEVILVDEGDIDACRAICDMYEFGLKKDPRIKTIHEKNGGYGASVNKGMKVARGEYISIIESDDFIEPKMYEELYAYAKKLDADVVRCPYYEYWDKTDSTEEKIGIPTWFTKARHVPENKTFSIEEYPILACGHPAIWAALYKRTFLQEKQIKCLEVKGAGYIDNHFRLQVLCQANKIAWTHTPYNYYRMSNPDASVAHYDVGAFIQRWADVHKLFEQKFPEKWELLGKYCIQEEWMNVFYRIVCEGFKISQEQYEIMVDNLAKTSEKQISSSPVLFKREAMALLVFKRSPALLKNYLLNVESDAGIRSASGYLTKYQLRILGLPLIKIKEKFNREWKVVLFGFIDVVKITEEK